MSEPTTPAGRELRGFACREIQDGLDARESWQTRHALARRLGFEEMDDIRGRSADCQIGIRHDTASQPVMDREALIRYIDWLVTHARLAGPDPALQAGDPPQGDAT